MSASLFDASIYPDSWFNRHCYYGGLFDKNRVYSQNLALHGVNAGDAKGKLIRAHHRESGAFSGSAISSSTTGEWVLPVTRSGKHTASCVDASVEPININDTRDLVTRVPMNGANGSSVFYDTTGNGVCVPVGGLTINNTVADPFGGYGGVADFTAESKSLGIYLPFNACPNGFSVPRQYTLRFWWYPKTLNATSYALVARVGTGAANQLSLNRNTTLSSLAIVNGGVGNTLSGTSLPTFNQWVFVEISKTQTSSAVTNRMFFSGTLHASGSTNHDYSSSTNYIQLGGNWTGYACDFEFFTTAKNTAAYSAPTARVPFAQPDAATIPLIDDSVQPL